MMQQLKNLITILTMGMRLFGDPDPSWKKIIQQQGG